MTNGAAAPASCGDGAARRRSADAAADGRAGSGPLGRRAGCVRTPDADGTAPLETVTTAVTVRRVVRCRTRIRKRQQQPGNCRGEHKVTSHVSTVTVGTAADRCKSNADFTGVSVRKAHTQKGRHLVW